MNDDKWLERFVFVVFVFMCGMLLGAHNAHMNVLTVGIDMQTDTFEVTFDDVSGLHRYKYDYAGEYAKKVY